MLKLIFTVFAAILFINIDITAQTPSHQIWEVKSFGINDGLASRTINAAICDQRGAMWFATNLGLNVYDGQKFVLYTDRNTNADIYLPDIAVHDVAEDENGNIWVSTAKGLAVIRSNRSGMLLPAQLGIPDSIATQGNSFIERRPQGGLWLICNQFLYLYQNKGGKARLEKLTKIPFVPTLVTRMKSSKNGELWLLQINTVWVWKESKLTQLDYQIVDDKQNTVSTTLGDMGALLFNTWGDSITMVYGYGTPASMAINRVEKKWIYGSAGQHFFSSLPYFQAMKKFIAKNRPASFAHYAIQDVVKGARNQIWIITNNEVYLAYARFSQKFQVLEFTKQKSIRGIAKIDSDELWISFYDDLLCVNQSRIRVNKLIVFRDFEQLGKDTVLLALEAARALALASVKDGLVNIYKRFEYSNVLGLQRIGDKIWFIHSRDQLTCMRLGDWRIIQQIDLDGKGVESLNGYTQSLIKGKGSDLWAAGDGGLYKISKGKNGMYKMDNQEIPDLIRNMPANALLMNKDGTLWIGSVNNGLWHYNPYNKKIRQYSTQDGLANNTIFSIMNNADGTAIWVGTANGLCRLQLSSGSFTNYYEQDGIAHNEFNTSSVFRARNGYLYFGGINGVTYFRENTIDRAREAIQAYVDIKVTNLATGRKKTYIPKLGETLKLPAHKQLIEFQFLSNNLYDADKVKYLYRISGQSDYWRTVSAKERLIFGKMDAGEYILELKAISAQGIFSPLYHFHFRVPQFWYRSWWFFSLLGLLIFLVSYVIFQFRLAELRKFYSIRKQIADDLHDDLGSRLQALKSVSFKIMYRTKKGEPITQLINDLEDMSKDALGVIRNFIWAFDPKKDLALDLMERMEDYVNISIRPIVPKISFRHNGSVENIKVSPTVKHHCLLAFQEILINMSKHTNTQEINVLAHIHQHSFTLHIINCFKPLKRQERMGEGYGNESIQHRVKEIGGQFLWKNHLNQQEAEIIIPFS